MTEEVCARPPCEHPASHHVVIGGCNIDTERGLCPCPGYRTEAQQEAVGQASEALDKLRRCYWGPYSVEFAEAALERLLELYP